MAGSESNCACDLPKSCTTCNPDKYILERLDYWYSAKGALTDPEAGWSDDYCPDPQDVLMLAIFLAGENVSP